MRASTWSTSQFIHGAIVDVIGIDTTLCVAHLGPPGAGGLPSAAGSMQRPVMDQHGASKSTGMSRWLASGGRHTPRRTSCHVIGAMA